VTPEQVVISTRKKKKNCFEVQTPNRTYYLVADSENEMNNWINIIKQSCSSKDGQGGGQTKKIGVQDFELLHVIGKGSFGKVISIKLSV
jgi:hypothetical protein